MTPEKKNPTTKVWIIVSAGLVLIVGLAAVLAFAGGDKKAIKPAVVVGTVEEYQTVTVTGPALRNMSDPDKDRAVGTQAPQIDGKSFDGTPVSIKPGKPTLIVLLAHWCPHCQREVPRLVQWNQDGGVPAGIDIVGISTSAKPARPNWPASAWLAKERFPWPVLADDPTTDAAIALGLTGFPTFVFLDAEGKVLFRASGELEMNALRDRITSALRSGTTVVGTSSVGS